MATQAASRTDERLDARPAGGGRPARAVLLHALGAPGGYLAAALGGAPGFAALHRAAAHGGLGLPEVLLRAAVMAAERVHATTPEERGAMRELPAGPRTLRKRFCRMLEHHWEHLAELSRRLGGPPL